MASVKRIKVKGNIYDVYDENAIHELPIASKTVSGCVKIGDGVNVTEGVLNANVTSVNGQTGAVTVGGGVGIVVSATQPSSQSSGDFWYEVVS